LALGCALFLSVVDLFSNPATQPATIYPACATYCGSWAASDSGCSNSCGTGTVTRSYVCSTGNSANW